MITRSELISLLTKVSSEAGEMVGIGGGWEDGETGESVRQVMLHEGLISKIDKALDSEWKRLGGGR